MEKSGGAREALATMLSPLAVSLRYLGESSFSRAKMNLNSIGSDNLRLTLVELFEGKCSGMNGLRYAHRLISDAVFQLFR